MYWNLPSVTISSLQRTTKPLTDNEMVCVFKQCEPAFFTVKPSRMTELLNTEKEINYFSKSLEDMLNEMHSNGRIDHDVYQELFGLL